VLASITGIVLEAVGRNGPSSVVQLSDDRNISSAIHKIVAELQLSGMLGFDFIIEERSGDAYLIEMNPRATQMGHLALGDGRDLAAAIAGVFIGRQVRAAQSVTKNDVIAFFPQEWLRDAKSPYLKNAYHDVPWDQPALVRACLEETFVIRAWSALSARLRPTRGWLDSRHM
jgi:hypothetical protein